MGSKYLYNENFLFSPDSECFADMQEALCKTIMGEREGLEMPTNLKYVLRRAVRWKDGFLQCGVQRQDGLWLFNKPIAQHLLSPCGPRRKQERHLDLADFFHFFRLASHDRA